VKADSKVLGIERAPGGPLFDLGDCGLAHGGIEGIDGAHPR